MKKIFNQKGVIHTLPLLVIVAAVGIISFLLISSTLPLGGLFGELNPKPASQAATEFRETFDGAPTTPGLYRDQTSLRRTICKNYDPYSSRVFRRGYATFRELPRPLRHHG